jgi:phosphoglycolate phosphatase
LKFTRGRVTSRSIRLLGLQPHGLPEPWGFPVCRRHFDTIGKMTLPRLLVFDLDGTLVDSQIDLARSINATLIHFGKQALPPNTIANYIGDGASALVRRALAHAHLIASEPDPHDNAFVAEALDWFIAYYKIHKLDCTAAYPGVVGALAEIRQRHPALPMAVLTNKPVDPSRAICAALGLDRYFFQNYGGNSFATKKPDPEGLLKLMVEATALRPGAEPVLPCETVLIGDSHVDVETARACGARSLGCTYGLSPTTLAAARPDRTVDHARDWPRALGL